MTRHLLTITDLDADELATVLELATRPDLPKVLAGLGVALIFEKPSNRTRQSMEMAVVQLGGHPVYTQGSEVQFDTREPVEDITRVMAGYHGRSPPVSSITVSSSGWSRSAACRWSTCSATTPIRCRAWPTC